MRYNKKDYSKDELIKNSFWSIFISIVGRIGALILTVIIVRSLLPKEFGIYSIVLSIFMIFYTFTDLGINSTLLRYMSFSIRYDKEKSFSYYKYLLKIKFILVMSFAFLLLLLAYPISYVTYKNPAMFLPLLISSVYLIMYSFEGFYSMIFYATDKVKYLGMKELISQLSKIGLILVLFLAFDNIEKISGIFIIYLIVSLLTFLYIIYNFNIIKGLIFYKKPKEVKIDKKRALRYMFFLTLGTLSASIFVNIDSAIIGFYLQAKYVGYYKAAFSLILGAITLISSANTLFMSYFTKLKGEKLTSFLDNILRYMSMIVFPATLGCILVGKYFIVILFDYAYIQSVTVMNVLSILIAPSVFSGILSFLLYAKEKESEPARIMIKIALINIALILIFINAYSTFSQKQLIEGVAATVVISYFIYLALTLGAVRRILHIKPKLFITKPLICSLIMYISSFILIKFLGDINLAKGVIIIAFAVFVYFLSLYIFEGIEKKDFYIIKTLIIKNR